MDDIQLRILGLFDFSPTGHLPREILARALYGKESPMSNAHQGSLTYALANLERIGLLDKMCRGLYVLTEKGKEQAKTLSHDSCLKRLSVDDLARWFGISEAVEAMKIVNEDSETQP